MEVGMQAGTHQVSDTRAAHHFGAQLHLRVWRDEALCMCSLGRPTCSMYGVHECYQCKSVPNRSEPAGAASVPWTLAMQQHLWQPFLGPPSALGTKRVHHVLSIPSSPLLWFWHAGTPRLVVYMAAFRHEQRNQAQLPPAAASVSPHSAASLLFQPIGHLVAVVPFARYPRVGPLFSLCPFGT